MITDVTNGSSIQDQDEDQTLISSNQIAKENGTSTSADGDASKPDLKLKLNLL